MEKPPNSGGAEPFPDQATPEASDVEDLQLVAALRSGDSRAFDRLFDKYRERIFRILFGILRNREDALDATQEVFIKVHRAAARFDPRARFFTWLYRVAVHQGIDAQRRRRTRHEQFVAESALDEGLPSVAERSGAAPARTPGDAAEQRELIAKVEGAMAQLSDMHRVVLELFAREGLEYAEIAEVLEVPVGTVMSRLFYARRKLRELLPTECDPASPEGDR